MKRANSQEPKADSSHSCFDMVTGIDNQVPSGSNCRATSAAMLGLALSVSASGVLLADGEASAAIDLQSASTASEALSDLSPSDKALASSERLDSLRTKTSFHTVEQGDSLWQIAQDHKVDVQDIKVANRIAPDILLQVGQVLKVPVEEPLASDQGSTLLASVSSEASDAYREHSFNEQSVADSLMAEASLQASATNESISIENTVAAEAPTTPTSVFSVADVAQEDSLRSAGLVSQSDGFRQELTRLEVAKTEVASVEASPQEIEASLPRVTALNPAISQQHYQVRPGDTVHTIAQSLGITAEELIQSNTLESPHVILAGQTLVLPANARSAASEPVLPVIMATSPVAATAPTTSFVGQDTRLARLQSTATRQVNADLLNRLQGVQAEVVTSSDVESSVDPYAANLIDQVESARQQVATENFGGPSLPVITAEPDVVTNAPLVNPEFQARQGETDVTTVAVNPGVEQRDSSELLAAAPLSPEAYFPSNQPSTGQFVSPEMPILPDSGEYLPDAPARFNGYIWPTRGTLTSGFGRRWGRMHQGVDVAAPVGTPIMAAASGTVERSGWNSGGYGNLVEVRHPDGSLTRYAHNSRLLVRAGQQVSQGQQIAEMGSTGYSTGPHLHFEIHVPSQGAVNPIALLPRR